MAVPYAKVCIWLPNGFSHFMGIGHASLKVMTPDGEKLYITWLLSGSGCSGASGSGGQSKSQGTEAAKCLGFTRIRNRHTGAIVNNPDSLGAPTVFSYRDDRFANANRMGLNDPNAAASANYKISLPVQKIPCLAPDDNLYGVNVSNMARWWRELLDLPPGHPRRRYAALSTDQNCCGVVVRALQVGGLGMYADPPCNVLYQGAKTLLNWARAGANKIIEMNIQARQVAIQLQGLPPLTPEQRGMPTLEVWKRISYVGPFARRKEQIAAIDRLIPKYHAAQQQNDIESKFRVLVEMHCQIFSHLTQKPTSDRRPAVLFLARVVTNLIQQDAGVYVPLAQMIAAT
jgi:hypothetical protein